MATKYIAHSREFTGIIQHSKILTIIITRRVGAFGPQVRGSLLVLQLQLHYASNPNFLTSLYVPPYCGIRAFLALPSTQDGEQPVGVPLISWTVSGNYVSHLFVWISESTANRSPATAYCFN